MKFDVVVGNPPYQEDTDGAGRQARPLYNLFVEQIQKMGTPVSSIIMPSRWFAGGMGLNRFRDEMMNDKHIKKLVDFPNSKDIFENTSIGGGVCYFVRDTNYSGKCTFVNSANGVENSMVRSLDEFPVLVRYNKAVSIIRKIASESKKNNISQIMSSLMPFGLGTDYRGNISQSSKSELRLFASSESITFVARSEVNKGIEFIDKYNVLISKTASEHAGEPDRSGMFNVIPSSIKVIKPGEICTHSYFVAGRFDSYAEAYNLLSYLKTKFVRFLVLQSLSGIGLSKQVFTFVPMQDFSKTWTDAELYRKYNLTDSEMMFVDKTIKVLN